MIKKKSFLSYLGDLVSNRVFFVILLLLAFFIIGVVVATELVTTACNDYIRDSQHALNEWGVVSHNPLVLNPVNISGVVVNG